MAATECRVAVVGCGGWGSGRARNVEALGHDIVACAEVDPDRRERFADEFDADPYADFEDLPYADLDAVVVGTPNRYHAPAAIRALSADVPPYVAKPMAADLDAAREMLAAEAESDAHGMIGFNSRFTPAAALVTAYRDAGYFGEISHVEASTIRRRGIPGVGSWFTDADLAGGGALVDIGVHAIDRVCYYLDFPEVVEVSGRTRSQFGGPEYADPDGFGGNWETETGTFDVDDSASAFVRFADGATLSLEVAWACNRPSERRVVLRGTDGGATEGGGDAPVTLHDADTAGVDHYVDRALDGSRELDSHPAALDTFFEAVTAGDPPAHCTFEEAAHTQRIMDAIYRSEAAGRAVEPDPA
jgi:predicted dehydrogenase